MKTFWTFVLCVLGFYARGDQLTIPGTNRVDAIILNGGDLATALTNKLLNAAGSVSASNLATGAATNNIGYQPANRAGDSIGSINLSGSTIKSTTGASYATTTYNNGSGYITYGWDTQPGYNLIHCYMNGNGSGPAFITVNGGFYAFASSATVAAGSDDTYIGRDAPASVQLGRDAASPVSQTLKSCDGSGTDKDGASLTIEGGQSTGTGAGGDVIVQTSIYTNSSGSTLRAYTTRSYDRAKPTALTDATTNLLFTVSLPVGCHVGGLLDATIFATDGTDFKSHNSAGVSFSAVNKGGTITASISESAQLETHSESVGTQMTDTWTVQQSGSTVAILVTPGVGSLMTPSTFNCKWGIVKMNSNGPATVTPN